MIVFEIMSNTIAVILLVLACVRNGNSFNLSPKPNIVIHEPKNPTIGMPKLRSSYFGFTINLKQNSVIIGAPRSQSTLEVQRKINETGAIYKCNLDNNPNGQCIPFVFDPWGNVHENYDQYTYNNEKKDFQWLGAAMDGSANDNDKLVVCAPRLISDISDHYLMHGICYWTTNTSSGRPANVQKIAPLRFKDKQQSVIDRERYFYYMYGEQGLSVHITENNEEILIGAPGIFTWKGSVIRHKAKPLVDLGGLSRRNNEASSFPRRRTAREMMEYSSDIPNPMFWQQDDNSYFGFAVSSGYFDGTGKSKLLYVASAPQANLQQGAVYIFDIIDHYSASDKTIKIYHTFPGQQFGEYFGYSLLTEDFDSDGLTDIAIGAPYNSKFGTHENGAVYIYKNEGTSSNFVLHATLRSDYEFSGRFGTTLSKVGDINQDGFNDLIIAAPFEGNGAIYIYHGSLNGLPTKPTQRIAAPQNGFLSSQMFGHGLSKGADIDGNRYLDIAVGAPNGEAVYIYKSYPVLRMVASITPFSQEIQTNDKSFKFDVCWNYESKYPINFDVQFNGTIKLDGQLNRALFKDNTNTYELNRKITSNRDCELLEAFVTFSIADIFRPIEIELTHNIINGIPKDDNSASETQEFCDTCVAVEPSDLKNVKNKVVFSTGCKSARCVADLRIKSSMANIPSIPYVLGSTPSIIMAYDIQNRGETAYLAQIRITLPESGVLFTKTPSNCKLDEKAPNSNIMECDLNNGTPMFKGDKTAIKISIDTTKLDASELVIQARVFSTGDELNELDNVVDDVIPLKEFSNIEIIGDSIKNRLTFQNAAEKENLTHIFEIHNNGPSNIKSLDILVSLPVSHINPWTLNREKIIDLSSVSMKSMHNGKTYDVEWTQNNTILILDAVESTSISTSSVPVVDYNGMQYDSSKLGLDFDFGTAQPSTDDTSTYLTGRKRSVRAVEFESNTYFNPYLQRVVESNEMGSTFLWNEIDAMTSRSKRDTLNSNDHILANLPANRTIFSDCRNSEQELCLQGKFTVENFRANDFPILITLNFTVDLKKVEKVMTEKKDVFVIRTLVEVVKTADEDTSSISVIESQPFTIISKYVISTTPLWVYILSIIVGILSLILISYALYRFGFFKRGTRDELVKLKRASEAMSYYPPDNNEDF